MAILVRNATVVTVNDRREILPGTSVLVEADRIADIGPTEALDRRHSDAEVIDGTSKVLFPGLINTHTHMIQALFKGLGDDRTLHSWFNEMTGPASANLDSEDCYWAALHSCVEAIRSGCTTVADFMYAHPAAELTDAIIQGFTETGLRGVVGRGYITGGTDVGIPTGLVEGVEAVLKDCQRIVGRYHRPQERLCIAIAPSMIWAVDEHTLRESRAFAAQYKVPVHIHTSSSLFERDYCADRYGMSTVRLMESIGFLAPDTVCVHSVHVSADDLRILKEIDAKVSHNPVSNMYLASGFPPIPEMLAAGITVGLASDGPASNNNQNMIHVLKAAALMHKVHTMDATAMTAERVLEMATIDGARALGLEHQIGSIEVGKKADLALLDFRNVFASPVHNPVSALVYAALGNEPEAVIIDGRVVLRDGRVTTVDEGRMIEQSQRLADSLCRRAGLEPLRERPWRSQADGG